MRAFTVSMGEPTLWRRAVPYSLVSAATLGFDLVRLPAGRSVAEVLLVGLGANAADLDRIAAAHPARGLDRERRGVLAVRSRRAREMAASVPHVRDAAATGADRVTALVTQLEQGTIGDAPTLERLLREDVLGPEHPFLGSVGARPAEEAADVLADAAVGFWAAGVLPPLVRRELTAAFDQVADSAPVAGPGSLNLGAAGTELAAFLDGLRELDDAGRARWRTAVDDGRAERRPWATAM